MYQFKSNKFTIWYDRLVQNAIQQNRIKSNHVYYEKHHIIPKSLGGNNSKLNLVLLTAREHFIAHLLLVRMAQDCDVYKMVNAIRRFTKKVSTSKDFERIKNTISTFSKGHLNPSYGRIWIHNVETNNILYVKKEEFSLMNQTVFKKGLPYQRGGHRNTVWVNNKIEETCIQKNDLADYLNKGWVKGKITKPTLEHMQHMSKRRHTALKDLEHSKKLTGRITLTHKITKDKKRVNPADVDYYKSLGYTDNIVLTTALSYRLEIEGIIYNSLGDAAKSLNMLKRDITYRLKSDHPKWSRWNKLQP